MDISSGGLGLLINSVIFEHTVLISSNAIYSVCFDWLIRNTFPIQYQPNMKKPDGESGGLLVESVKLLPPSQPSEYTHTHTEPLS